MHTLRDIKEFLRFSVYCGRLLVYPDCGGWEPRTEEKMCT